MLRLLWRLVALGLSLVITELVHADYTFTAIDVPDAIRTIAHGINDAGNLVGSYSDGFRNRGFLRSSEGDCTTLDLTDATESYALGINNRDEIVGWYFDGFRTHGFLRSSDGAYTPLDVPDATRSYASGINDGGDIVGFYS